MDLPDLLRNKIHTKPVWYMIAASAAQSNYKSKLINNHLVRPSNFFYMCVYIYIL